MTDRVYLTTPLYYVNAEPHLGHTYTTVVVDTLARYHRSCGRDVFFMTGTDEHGDKIAAAAHASDTTPRTYADRISAIFRSTWDTCGITYDHFIRTTDDYHVALVQEILERVHAAGDIYFGDYGGNYCVGCERFYAERELVDGKCPDHETETEWIKEENYFFKMSSYQDRLIGHLEKHPDMIRPAGYKNEVLGLLREPLEDLCISRPKSRLAWGIELPFDENYVTYVWFDALINYLSGLYHLKGEQGPDYWAGAQHFIAKDILKPHAVFWPTMLMAAGYPVYHHLNVHGYWNMGESKMSKSLGNVIRPLEMKERFGLDSFRYFLLREMAFGMDSSFTEDAFIARFNADLSNGLGNLASRVLAMQKKYFAGRVQSAEGLTEALDAELEAAFVTAETEMKEHMDNLAIHVALEAVWKALNACDKYIVETAPFKLWKEESQRPRVGAILHVLCDALRHTARLIDPFMPETAERLRNMLSVHPEPLSLAAPAWGGVFVPGHQLADPESLFPRLDVGD